LRSEQTFLLRRGTEGSNPSPSTGESAANSGSRSSERKRRRSVAGRCGAGPRNPSEPARVGDIEEVFDRHRHTGEGRGDITGRTQAILGIGSSTRGVAVDLGKGARSLGRRIGDLVPALFRSTPDWWFSRRRDPRRGSLRSVYARRQKASSSSRARPVDIPRRCPENRARRALVPALSPTTRNRRAPI